MLMKLVSVWLKIANYREFSDEEQFEPHWYSLRGHGNVFLYKQETLFQVLRHILAHYWDSDMLMKPVSVGLKIANYCEFSDEEQFKPHWYSLRGHGKKILFKQDTLFQVLRHILTHYWDSDMLMKPVSVGLKIANCREFSDEEQFEPHWYSLRGNGKTFLFKQETFFQVLRHISAHYWDGDLLMKLVSVGLKIANYREFSDEEQFEPHWYSLLGHGKKILYKTRNTISSAETYLSTILR
jgi:hypothetical protein